MNIITARKASRNKTRVVALDGELVASRKPYIRFLSSNWAVNVLKNFVRYLKIYSIVGLSERHCIVQIISFIVQCGF